jgi:hypothetical protein
MKSNKALICRLLGISQQDYEMQLFETAFKYLELRLKDDDDAKKALTSGKFFWLWWNRQWENRNERILHTFNFTDVLMNPSEITRKRARVAYDAIHCVDRFNFYINEHVVKSSFDKICDLERTASKFKSIKH